VIGCWWLVVGCWWLVVGCSFRGIRLHRWRARDVGQESAASRRNFFWILRADPVIVDAVVVLEVMNGDYMARDFPASSNWENGIVTTSPSTRIVTSGSRE
jgi:hypothetical protein